MIEFQFRVLGSCRYPHLRVTDLPNALEAVLFVLLDLELQKDWYIVVTDQSDNWRDFPTIHLQKTFDNYFLQVFSAESWSPDGQEGWFTLTGKKYDPTQIPYRLSDKLIMDDSSYFNAEFSQGIAFSKGFLVKEKRVSKLFQHFLNKDKSHWFEKEKWINLGLV